MYRKRKRGKRVKINATIKVSVFIISLICMFILLIIIITETPKIQISQSPSIIPGDTDGDGFYDNEEIYCGSNPADIYSTPQISCIIDKRLNESDQKEAVRGFLQNQRNILPLRNNGADYSSNITSAISSLPSGNKILTIPNGRYKISSTLWFDTNENITIQAAEFGGVILEADGLAEGNNLFHAFGDGSIIIKNLTLWGEKTKNSAAIDLFMDNSKVISNAIINFDGGLILDPFGAQRGRNTEITNNYFFDNGYLALKIDGGYNANTKTCTEPIGPFNLTGNFLSGNYQGISILCAENGLIEDNIVRDSFIAGLRSERSWRNMVRHNLMHRNTLQGFWIYGNTTNSVFERNIVIDNNKGNQPFFFDCWNPQSTLKDDYLNNRPGLTNYPYLRQENGSYLFTNYWCQFNGQEVELRNSISRNNFTNNIIGRFSKTFNNINWESPLDLIISYYPQFYSSRAEFLSSDNIFENNYFINPSNNRILDGGCGNQYINNKAVNVLDDTESQFSFIPVEDEICAKVSSGTCSSSGVCNPCNNNNLCEPLIGENVLNCADCKLVQLGQSGTRQHKDECIYGLNKTEAIFPANPECINIYDGSFKCTDGDNGIFEPQYGENYCNLPDADKDGISDEWEIQYNLTINDPNDASLDPDADGRSNLQEFKDGTNPNNPDTPPEPSTPGNNNNNGGNGNGGSSSPTPQCRDGRDNDHDGKIDYPNDPGCLSRNDNSEIDTALINGTCTENWECTSYGLCLNDIQIRSCEDTNNCNTLTRKPSIEKLCSDEGSSGNNGDNENNNILKIVSLIILPVLTLAVIVAVIFTIKAKKK